ncbi:hypothetical protein JVU11DRAFT_9730 [Chiua virens]|nr:hypothetical protein JVU11DRAFT_9730 [Chiua virens]
MKMKTSDGDIVSEYRCDSVIGCAVVSIRKGLVVIDNAQNGFCLYRLDEPLRGPIRSFLTNPPKVRVPKQVAFGKATRIVVGGSDNGSVYIFERKTGRVLETLRHASDGLVQTVSVSATMICYKDSNLETRIPGPGPRYTVCYRKCLVCTR